MNYCESCIHFTPNEGRRNLSTLCEKKHKLEFKEPESWRDIHTYDYGFHCDTCEDFCKEKKIDYTAWTVYVNENNLK